MYLPDIPNFISTKDQLFSTKKHPARHLDISDFKKEDLFNVNVNPWHDGSGEPRPTELVAAI